MIDFTINDCMNYFSVKDVEDISLVLGSASKEFELPLFFSQSVTDISDINTADCGTPTVDLIENPTQSVANTQSFTSSIASITTT